MDLENLAILLVDDESLCRKILAYALIDLGIDREKIKQAANGQEALDVLKNFKPDIVITDYNMPIMNGLEFVKKLKADSELSKISVIFYTGETNILYYAQKEGITDALKLELSPSEEELKTIIMKAIAK